MAAQSPSWATLAFLKFPNASQRCRESLVPQRSSLNGFLVTHEGILCYPATKRLIIHSDVCARWHRVDPILTPRDLLLGRFQKPSIPKL